MLETLGRRHIAVAIDISAPPPSRIGTTSEISSAPRPASGRPEPWFTRRGDLGQSSVIAGAGFGIGLAFGSRTSRGRIIAATASAVCLLPLVLSLSRGAWIGCGLAFLYLLLVLREARRALLVAVLPLAIAAALVGSFAPSTPEITIIGERARAITAISPYDY